MATHPVLHKSLFPNRYTSTVGGLAGQNRTGIISNSYAAGSVTGTGTNAKVGGLVGENSGTISGTNHFVANAATPDGVHTGTCAATCSQATDPSGDATRITWLQNTLNEMTILSWSDRVWKNFSSTTGNVGYPLLKYAQVSYCSDSSHATEDACLAPGSCSIDPATNTNRAACEGATPTKGIWMPINTWLAGGDECGGTTGVVCGARISGRGIRDCWNGLEYS